MRDVGTIPEVPQFVQASEPHPEARIPEEWIASFGALAGVLVGLLLINKRDSCG